ncbi:glycoside hydrolase family 36 protein [Sphingomonas sp. DT-51]|uniref:glycoside hydrolase family 36 protein n=1 Tax=Sphingomonas sp. DT-51 TaxID=3396165 RepID=UPI003F1DB31F
MRKVALAGALAGCLLAASTMAQARPPAAMETRRSVTIAGLELTVAGTLDGFALEVHAEPIAPGVARAVLTLTRATPAPPPRLTIRWSQPSVDMAGMWTPDASLGRTIVPDFASTRLRSTLTAAAPVLALYGRGEQNRLTVAVEEAVTPVLLAARVREEDVRVYGSVELFSERHAPLTRYTTSLRLDTRAIPVADALGDVAAWWSRQPGKVPVPAPPGAREPLDSTWYSYHQAVDEATVLAEAEAAARHGFTVMIVDDGWQTGDTNRGYAHAGDWRPERLRRMRVVTDALHARGMKGMLWFSVPLVGDDAAVLPRFRGKILRRWAEQRTNVLDPRYPEVRAYLVETFRHAVRDWGWDGLKLDFIDMFSSDEATVLDRSDGRDIASVYEAVNRLMMDVMTALRAVRPDVLIEFRQPYSGPVIRTFGNMLRASDAPNESILNRQRIVDLRLLAGATPVHADPIVWHPEEPSSAAALQLLDTLFAVPQVSMRLDTLTPAHAAMLTHYLAYWRANRAVLLDGRLRPEGINAQYELVRATTTDKQIVAAYADRTIVLDQPARGIDLVNATAASRLVVEVTRNLGRYEARATDAEGRAVSRTLIDLTRGAHVVAVPPAGIVALVRRP